MGSGTMAPGLERTAGGMSEGSSRLHCRSSKCSKLTVKATMCPDAGSLAATASKFVNDTAKSGCHVVPVQAHTVGGSDGLGGPLGLNEPGSHRRFVSDVENRS